MKTKPRKTLKKQGGALRSENSHTCDAVVLMCIDFRFRKWVPEEIEKRDAKKFDLVSYPGASLSLTSEKSLAHDAILSAIEIARNLHNIREVIIVEHEDCGAYGGASAFESKDHEEAAHGERATAASALIQRVIGIPTRLFYARLEGKLERI